MCRGFRVPGVPEVLLNRLEQAPATFRISGIRTALPGISDGTIRNALDDLRRDGLVEVDGTGRGVSWSRR